jgi:hypothetical protein
MSHNSIPGRAETKRRCCGGTTSLTPIRFDSRSYLCNAVPVDGACGCLFPPFIGLDSPPPSSCDMWFITPRPELMAVISGSINRNTPYESTVMRHVMRARAWLFHTVAGLG